jgi:putative DNA primase/helicase
MSATAQEVLAKHGIAYIPTRKHKYTTKCPSCGGGYLNVEIKRDGVVWYCQACKDGGGEPYSKPNGNGGIHSDLGPIKATYDYLDELGERLFQVVKYEPLNSPKQFRQRTGPEQKKWSIKGVRIVPYRLPELITAVAGKRTIFLVEGEKDVETLRAHGVPATCNAMGAGKWRKDFAAFFDGADVVICGDNDAPGRDHVQDVARKLKGRPRRIRILDLARFWADIEESDDISDWFARGGGTVEQLERMLKQVPDCVIEQQEPRADKSSRLLEDQVALDFAAHHADQLRYIAKSSQWMRWNATCWQPEDTLAAFDESRKLCRPAGDARAKTVAAVVTLARSDRRLAATAAQWDVDPMRLQTTRTTIDLRNGFEYQPERSHYITKRTSTHLAPSGTPHPRWSDFLDVVTEADERLIGFLQRIAGYCLTGLTREHVLLFIYGPGRNGKGVFVNTLAAVMGDYAISAPMEMFLLSKFDRHATEIARLKGARLVTAQETQKGRRWDETKLKVLTSSNPLSGRFMRQDYFDFDPTHKLIITGNHKPGLSAVNEAIRRRLLLTLFKTVIPKPDPDFTAKLVPEHPAILRWMVDGCLEWQRDGLDVPDAVREASDQYFAGQDSLEQWLDDCVDTNDPRAFTTTRKLYTSWKIWSEARGMSAETERAFSDSLEEKGHEWERRKYGRGFKGLKLRADDCGLPLEGAG